MCTEIYVVAFIREGDPPAIKIVSGTFYFIGRVFDVINCTKHIIH